MIYHIQALPLFLSFSPVHNFPASHHIASPTTCVHVVFLSANFWVSHHIASLHVCVLCFYLQTFGSHTTLLHRTCVHVVSLSANSSSSHHIASPTTRVHYVSNLLQCVRPPNVCPLVLAPPCSLSFTLALPHLWPHDMCACFHCAFLCDPDSSSDTSCVGTPFLPVAKPHHPHLSPNRTCAHFCLSARPRMCTFQLQCTSTDVISARVSFSARLPVWISTPLFFTPCV